MLPPPNGSSVAVEVKTSADTPFHHGDFGLERKEAGPTHHHGINASTSIKAIRTQPSAVPTHMGAIDSALLSGVSTAKPSAEQIDDNLELLHTVLHKIARLDTEKCFIEPVTEEQAPGYFQVCLVEGGSEA